MGPERLDKIKYKLIAWREPWQGFPSHVLDPTSFLIDYRIKDNLIDYRHTTIPTEIERANCRLMSNSGELKANPCCILEGNGNLGRSVENLRTNYDSLTPYPFEDDGEEAQSVLDESILYMVRFIEKKVQTKRGR